MTNAQGNAFSASPGSAAGGLWVEEASPTDEPDHRPTDSLAVARSLAFSLGFEFVDLDELTLDPAVRSVLPEAVARRVHAIPISPRLGAPAIVVGLPGEPRALEEIRAAVGDGLRVFAAERTQVDRYLQKVYLPAQAEVHPERSTLVTKEYEGLRPTTFSAVASSPAPVDTTAGGRAAADTLAGLTADSPPSTSDRPRDESIGGLGPAHLQRRDRLTLEAALVSSGKVSREDMEAALLQQSATGRPLRDLLAEAGVDERDIVAAVAETAGLEFADLNRWAIDLRAWELLPESLCRRYHVLPLGHEDELPVIAIADPSNVFALDDIRALLGRRLRLVVCTQSQIDEYVDRTYRRNVEADIAARSAAFSSASDNGHGDLNDLHVVVEDAPIVQFVNAILRQALGERASDIHIEPTAGDLQVRFRIDGVLHRMTTAPRAIQGGVTSRLKIMADLDIAEHRVPQDGRISLSAGDRDIDMRVATLPTVHGEKVVLRVLDRSNAPLDLAKLGFLADVQERYATAYRKPSGTILVTGPTGSGKSTTLYATLNKLNSPERNLITVEDPAEYQLDGVSQIQVNPKAGLGFANALRAILRSDPDVLLVGEIRDRETATIAVEAAMTGHLVLSSLHTNDAASTPMRLIEMGVEPFLVCSALDCVLAQRLARLLCENCAEVYQPTEDELESAGWQPQLSTEDGPLRFRRAGGCQVCSRTGYRGRLAIQEVLLVSEDVERAVLSRAHTEEIRRLAIAEGMRPLREDGLRKAALGMTSLEEIVRVIT